MGSGMICWLDHCRRPIGRGETARRVEWHMVGGQELVFGEGTGRPLAEAAGPLLRTAHGKCYFTDLKRTRMGLPELADPPAQTG